MSLFSKCEGSDKHAWASEPVQSVFPFLEHTAAESAAPRPWPLARFCAWQPGSLQGHTPAGLPGTDPTRPRGSSARKSGGLSPLFAFDQEASLSSLCIWGFSTGLSASQWTAAPRWATPSGALPLNKGAPSPARGAARSVGGALWVPPAPPPLLPTVAVQMPPREAPPPARPAGPRLPSRPWELLPPRCAVHTASWPRGEDRKVLPGTSPPGVSRASQPRGEGAWGPPSSQPHPRLPGNSLGQVLAPQAPPPREVSAGIQSGCGDWDGKRSVWVMKSISRIMGRA